jgi:hypothetical protein
LRDVTQRHDQASAVPEFEADLDGVHVQDAHILRWDATEAVQSASRSWCARCGLQKLVELIAHSQLAAGQALHASPGTRETGHLARCTIESAA